MQQQQNIQPLTKKQILDIVGEFIDSNNTDKQNNESDKTFNLTLKSTTEPTDVIELKRSVFMMKHIILALFIVVTQTLLQM